MGEPARAGFTAMSTAIALLGVGVSEREVARAAADGRRLADAWDRRFSRFRPDSQLSRLNAATGAPVRVGPEFIALLEAATLGVRRTDGRFDPSVLPALEAAGYGQSIERVRLAPVPAVVPAPPAAGRSAWERVEIDRGRGEVRLPHGMRIDFGGVAKGAFVDRLWAILNDWPGGCIDAGGDLRVWGVAPDGERWTIGVEDPVRPEGDLLVAEVLAPEGVAVATSGTHRRQWRSGEQTVHHILDPRTGLPVDAARSATAFAASATTAEIATKALMVAADEGAGDDPFGAAIGVVVRADGHVELVGGGRAHAGVITLPAPARRSA